MRPTVQHSDEKSVCTQSLDVMSTGDLADFVPLVHPEAVNREAIDEPIECRGRGPAAFYATARWLRSAYADLVWQVHDAVAEGDLVVLHATMSGRHTGPFVAYAGDGSVASALPPTGKTFAVTQTHWFRLRDGMVVEHWANRDDFGQARQLGWVPPTPVYLVRMALAKRKAQRSVSH